MTHARQVGSLLVDDACRRVVAHFEASGQRFIVLKGATIATWLYRDPSERTYIDLDLLIPPEEEAMAVALLADLGFRPLLDRRTRHVMSPEEQPLADSRGVTIDLHVALKGIGLKPAEAWQVLHERAVVWNWGNTTVPALDLAARAMYLALHLAKEGLSDTKAAEDLARGLEQLDVQLWRRAATVADRLEALEAFTAALMLVPAGRRVAALLELPAPKDRVVLMNSDRSISNRTVALEALFTQATWPQRWRTAWTHLFPSNAWLRLTDPMANNGLLGLAAARAWRPIRVLTHTLLALAERRRFRRRAQ